MSSIIPQCVNYLLEQFMFKARPAIESMSIEDALRIVGLQEYAPHYRRQGFETLGHVLECMGNNPYGIILTREDVLDEVCGRSYLDRRSYTVFMQKMVQWDTLLYMIHSLKVEDGFYSPIFTRDEIFQHAHPLFAKALRLNRHV